MMEQEEERQLFSLTLESPTVPEYEPVSNWAGVMTIDRDIATMENLLAGASVDAFMEAKEVYEFGAFSWPIADLHLTDGAPAEIFKGTEILGRNILNQPIRAYVLQHAKPRQGKFRVEYEVDSFTNEAVALQCSGGGNPEPQFENCFTEKGAVSIDGIAEQVHYTYKKDTDNKNYRAVQRLSTLAGSKMKMCSHCELFHDFKKSYDYYQTHKYADAWIQAALAGNQVVLPEGGHGGADFSKFSFTARAHAIKKAASFMSATQFVVRDLEEAFHYCLEDCGSEGRCIDKAVKLVDSAVAFYSGSLIHSDGHDKGKLMYTLADEMCIKFKTCGKKGNSIHGTAKVNMEIFEEFSKIQQSVLDENCPSSVKGKQVVAGKINVPIIQATLEAAYKLDPKYGNIVSQEEQVIGATFSAIVEPLVNRCSQGDAKSLHDNLKTGHDSISFDEVKDLLEKHYKCMGVTCEEVGGFYNKGKGHYHAGAEPCVTPGELDLEKHLKIHLPWVSIIVCVLAFYGYRKFKSYCKERKRRLRRIDELNDLSDSDDEDDDHMVYA